MAKQSSIQKNLRRKLMVKQYKKRRLVLKKKIKNKDRIEINFPHAKETLIKANKVDLDIL